MIACGALGVVLPSPTTTDWLHAHVAVTQSERLAAELRWLSPIIVTFFCPAHKNFLFPGFYNLMKKKGFIIYPGKLTTVESFRIGCIGRMDENVMLRVVKAAEETLAEMGVSNATPPAEALLEKAKLEALG